MKSILERALVHLLNEENEKAEELLHQFVIETAKSIHESLRESDEELVDGEELEEAFSEADLDDDAAELGGELGEEMPEVADEDNVSDDTLDAGNGMEAEGEFEADAAPEGEADLDAGAEPADDIEAEIENFEQELADLQSKFDSWMADIEGGEGEEAAGDELAPEMDMDAEGEVEADAGMDAEFGGEEIAADDDVAAAEEGDEFDDITESVIDELQKVAAANVEGKGANGEDLLGNHASTKSARNATAKPINSTSKGHSGFARETAPSTTALKGGKTVASTKMRNVTNDSDGKAPDTGKGADIRTPAKDAANAKSPLSTKPKK